MSHTFLRAQQTQILTRGGDMSPRLDPASRPREEEHFLATSTDGSSASVITIKNKSDPIDRKRRSKWRTNGAIRGPSRADPRTTSARTNRENLPTNTWADWRTSRSPSDSPTMADSSNRLVQPLVKESRRRRHSPSQRPDDRSNCLRPMDTDMVPAMLHP